MHEGRIGRINIVSHDFLTVQDGYKSVKKTFRERFTWKFWQTYKKVPNIIPDPMFHIWGDTIFCHPQMVDALRKELNS